MSTRAMKTSRTLNKPRKSLKAYWRHQECSRVRKVFTAGNIHRLLVEKRRSGGLSSRSVGVFLARSTKEFIRMGLEEEETHVDIMELLRKALLSLLNGSSSSDENKNLDQTNRINDDYDPLRGSQVLENLIKATLETASSTDSRILHEIFKWLPHNVCQQFLLQNIFTKMAWDKCGSEPTLQPDHKETRKNT